MTTQTPEAAIASLDNVLTRLAMIDNDERLQSVLDKLLPRLVVQLDTKSTAVRDKVLSVLSHVMKRVRGLANVQLPLDELVAVYTANSHPFVLNFTLIFIEISYERCPPEALAKVTPLLLKGISAKPPAHHGKLLRMFACGLTAMSLHRPPPAIFDCLEQEADKKNHLIIL
eukprot:Rmarinus@m.5493